MTETKLPVILVLLLLGASVTASGSLGGIATATHAGGGTHHDHYNFDANLSTRSVNWQGQRLYVQGNASGVDYELHEVDGTTDKYVGERVRTISLDDRASAVIDTDSLGTGEYVLVDQQNRLVETNESGVQVATASQSEDGAIREASFTLADQTLNTSIDRRGFALSGTLEFTLDSNRDGFTVEVTSGQFTPGELHGLFGGVETDDGTRVTVTDHVLDADLSDVETGSYAFTFDVTDTDASASQTVTVSKPDDMRLVSDTIRETAGGLATINLTMQAGDRGHLVVGSADNGYRSVVGFKDDDFDGQVSLTMNTYLAGNHTGAGEAAAWSADAGDTITGVDLTTDRLTDPLAATGYELDVRTDGRHEDIGLLALGEPAAPTVTLWTAPGRQFDDSLNRQTRTRTRQFAVEDTVIAAMNASGWYGLYDAQPGDDATERFRSLAESANASFSMTLQDRNRANDPPELALARSIENGALRVHADSSNQTLYVVMDEHRLEFTRGRSKVRPDDHYQVEFELAEASGLVSSDRTGASIARFTDRTATIETGDNETLRVPADENATIGGSTTVAPGTEVRLVVRLNGTFHDAVETSVSANRTFAVPINLSTTTPGSNLSVGLRAFEASARGVVEAAQREPAEPLTPDNETTNGTDQPPVETPTPRTPRPSTPTPAGTDRTTVVSSSTPSSPTPANASDDPAPTTAQTPTTTPQTTTGSGPGFSLGLTVLTLLGIVCLGLGRRSEA